MSDSGLESVKKYTPRHPDFILHLANEMGKLDSDMAFGNIFAQLQLMWNIMLEVDEAILAEVIVLPKEYLPDKVLMEEMDMIWNGGCWLGVVRSDDGTQVLIRKLFFGYPPESFIQDGETYYISEDEKHIMPPLKILIPVEQIKKETWGIQIRDTLPLYIAWEGAELGTILNEGKFVHEYSDGIVPKVTAEDLQSRTKKTNILHRPVHFKLSQDLTEQLQRRYARFSIQLQKILKYVDDNDFSGFNVQELANDVSDNGKFEEDVSQG
jgi:hypothetical protein